MKRYVIGFWGTYLLSAALSVGLFFVAVGNWLFSVVPPWFGMLWLVVILLPFLAVGDLLAHKSAVSKSTRRKAFAIHIVIQLGFGILGGFLLGESVLQVVVWPGSLLGAGLRDLLDINSYWDGAFLPLGHALLPVFYHLGWCMGKPEETE